MRFVNYTDRDTEQEYTTEGAGSMERSGRGAGEAGRVGLFTSLIVAMTLEPGMFCTMALREVRNPKLWGAKFSNKSGAWVFPASSHIKQKQPWCG
jgi:hypothetical protein